MDDPIHMLHQFYIEVSLAAHMAADAASFRAAVIAAMFKYEDGTGRDRTPIAEIQENH